MLRLLDGYAGTLPVRCALRLAPLVFVRPGELIKAEWAGIDLEGAEWRHTVTKTGTPHVVPLARQVVAILREVHSLTGHGRYVFPNARYPHRERPMSHATLWSTFRALDIPRDRMTLHGFRAMARTILDEVLGFRPDFIEHQLAHAVRDPNGRAYNRTARLQGLVRGCHLVADWQRLNGDLNDSFERLPTCHPTPELLVVSKLQVCGIDIVYDEMSNLRGQTVDLAEDWFLEIGN